MESKHNYSNVIFQSTFGTRTNNYNKLIQSRAEICIIQNFQKFSILKIVFEIDDEC